MQIEIFSKVKDPGVLGKVKHELEDVLRIALIGVLCSCDDYDEISDLIEDNAEEFKSDSSNYPTECLPEIPYAVLSSLSIRRADACILSYLQRQYCIFA